MAVHRSMTSRNAIPSQTALGAGCLSVDYSEENGHFYALTDQKETKRQDAVA